MGINYFTDEQIELLKGNPYIEKVSKKSIKYSKQFKATFWLHYSHDESPSAILLSLGIDPKILGKKRISNIVQRVKMEAEREAGFKDRRCDNDGRPQTRNLSPEEKIAYLEHQLKFKNQQIEALKKINFVDKKAQWKLRKKNSKSLKK